MFFQKLERDVSTNDRGVITLPLPFRDAPPPRENQSRDAAMKRGGECATGRGVGYNAPLSKIKTVYRRHGGNARRWEDTSFRGGLRGREIPRLTSHRAPRVPGLGPSSARGRGAWRAERHPSSVTMSRCMDPTGKKGGGQFNPPLRKARVNGGEGEDDTAAAAAGEGEWRRGRG